MSLATIEDLRASEYVIAGDPKASYLIELVASVDGEPPAMPQEADPLSDEQVDLLRKWIAEGAIWPEDVVVREKAKADSTWWSLQPLVAGKTRAGLQEDSPNESTAEGTYGIRNESDTIDELVREKLDEQDLRLNPPADRRTLIRRATYDLIGLPPTPEEVEAFVNDPDANAYEQLIDRLLESPHYGEHWGRHWLDVVRFGESIGYERNVIVDDIWPFRDYVIRSLNEDKPFDQFIREHIAGDVFGKDDPAVAVGSAFLVAGPYDDVGNQDPAQAAQIRANTLDEIIRATSEAFLGMTVGCSRCHDHKFDAVTQRDYYGLYATFSGVRHGSVELATPEETTKRAAILNPLMEQKAALEKQQTEWKEGILRRAKERIAHYEAAWTRPPVDRAGTEDRFEPTMATFVRLVCEAQDQNASSKTGFGIDEFEVWSASDARNVALAQNGAKATGQARQIEDFPDAYGPHHAIDGQTGARFIARGPDLTIELAEPTLIDRVVFSSAKGEATPEHQKFVFVAEYRIEISDDGVHWREVASGRDRKPVNQATHLDRRLLQLEPTAEERAEEKRIASDLAAVNHQIKAIPSLPSVWIGTRVAQEAKGPFHVFLGGSPQKQGEQVVPASLEVFEGIAGLRGQLLEDETSLASTDGSRPEADGTDDEPTVFGYRLAEDASEADRRLALADWLVHPDNPLTPRVLVNRLWHYHFGTGIVDTPSDFGYMGGRPTHPELLDFLAVKLKQNGWRVKELHRLIMTSETYRQSSTFDAEAARIDGDARLLWRFPPRRLSAEEVRDTMLQIADKLSCRKGIQTLTDAVPATESESSMIPDGGPGFRLYHFMQDNVCTYVPLDRHGPETYRRAVYHQNARASVVDLMTEFDQPDCTFGAPKRAETTTPLQALTMLNHSFTLDMATALAARLQREAGEDHDAQVQRAYQLCYSRPPSSDELAACRDWIEANSLAAFCRVLLNTSELIYVR